jgi:hypothetical protein
VREKIEIIQLPSEEAGAEEEDASRPDRKMTVHAGF